MHLKLHYRKKSSTIKAIGNVELTHESFPKHSPMEIARMKENEEKQKCKKFDRRDMESKAGMKEK